MHADTICFSIMKITTLDSVPQLATVLQMQKEMSLAKSGAELTYAFARHFGTVTGVSYLFSLHVGGLQSGEFRLMEWMDFSDKNITRQDILAHSRRDRVLDDIPVQRSQVISRLIGTDMPTLAETVTPENDEVLSKVISAPVDCLSLPIYFNGQIVEWLIICREPGIPLQSIEVRAGVSNLNMLSRYHALLQLNNQIRELHDKLDKQIQEVGKVQRSLLPRQAPQIPGLSIAYYYEPCDVAGGDYFDFHQFDDGQLGIVIADVSGHGPGAAVVMAMLRTAMSLYRLFERSPEQIVEEINKVMCDGLHEGTYVTAVFLGIDVETGRVRFANAGHPHPRIRRADGIIEVLDRAVCPPLGIIDELLVEEGSFSLQPGDVLLLYTDGLSEAFSPQREQFGVARLDAILKDSRPEPDSLVQAISTQVYQHVAHGKLSDDVCMVAVRFDGNG